MVTRINGFASETANDLQMNNEGAVDLVNNYSVNWRARHMETKQYYLLWWNGHLEVETAVISSQRTYSAKTQQSCCSVCWKRIVHWRLLKWGFIQIWEECQVIIGVSYVQTRWGQQRGADVTVRNLMAVEMTQSLVIELPSVNMWARSITHSQHHNQSFSCINKSARQIV